jgi:hypothetical protein
MSSNRNHLKNACLLLFISIFIYSCSGPKGEEGKSEPGLAKNVSHDLTFETVSRMTQDMKRYTELVKKLDRSAIQTLDQNYQGVRFTTEQQPLFLNVYPDPAGGRIIFLLVQKDPSTGSNYLLTFDKKLPVIDSETVELQIRTKDPEKPLTCSLQVTDTAAYMTEYPSHKFVVQYEFTKKFLQSGTYDFDALTVQSYRQRGYAFITFDLAKASVKDLTANLTADCVD